MNVSWNELLMWALEKNQETCAPDVVIVAVTSLLHDELRVVEDESAHDDQAQVQVHLLGETDSQKITQACTMLSIHSCHVSRQNIALCKGETNLHSRYKEVWTR